MLCLVSVLPHSGHGILPSVLTFGCNCVICKLRLRAVEKVLLHVEQACGSVERVRGGLEDEEVGAVAEGFPGGAWGHLSLHQRE